MTVQKVYWENPAIPRNRDAIVLDTNIVVSAGLELKRNYRDPCGTKRAERMF